MKIFSFIMGISLAFCIVSDCGGKSETETVSRSTELIKQADALFDKEDKSGALDMYKMIVDTALAENDNSNLTEAYSQVARCYLSMENKDEGRLWLEKAEKIAKDTEPNGWARYLGVKGRFLWRDAVDEKGEAAPEDEEAAKIFTQQYDYAVAHQLHNQAVDAANMMSIVGNMQDRIEWGLKGIKAAEEGGLKNWLAPLWNNLGWNYNDLGRYRESLEALKKARRYHYIKGDEKTMLIADWSVAHAFRMTGQIDSAMIWGQRVVIWAKDMYDTNPSYENSEWLGMSYEELGESSLASGDKNRALAAFRSALLHLKKAGMEEWDNKGFKELQQKIDRLDAEAKKRR